MILTLSAVGLFDWPKLQLIEKRGVYAASYGSTAILQERVDEEGCGAVICAARMVPD